MRRFHRPYQAKPVTVDGYRFDSQAEARRYGQLKILTMANPPKIKNLVIHPKFPMVINGKNIGRGYMILDFAYYEWKDGEWRDVIEDVKGGADTHIAKLRRDVCSAINDIQIRVTTA